MSEAKKKKKFELPHVYTIAFVLIVVFAILTWIIPSGQYDRQTIETAAGTRDVAVAGTYHVVDKVDADGNDTRQGIFDVLKAPTRGIQAASDVVAFVLLIGGTFAIITKTNAITAGMTHLIGKLKNKDILIIPVVMILLSLGGTSFGMSEEALPFYAIFLPLMMSMGYDSMTAFLIVFMGPQIGYIASTVNPFNVLISQGIAQIQGNPQLWLRAITWVVFTVLTIIWVIRYALHVKKDPKSSITYLDDIAKRESFGVDKDINTEVEFNLRHKLVLVVFIGGLGLIVWGLLTKGWYMDEIIAVFLGSGLISGIIFGMGEKEMAETFVKGMGEFVYAAVIIGVARGILVIAEAGMIIDTILNFFATILAGAPVWLFTSLMFVVQGLLSILVPSSSGLASLTIPVMAPLTDLMGANTEASVTALCLSNQIMNTLSPTAGMTVAGLAVSKISFGQWWKTCWKFMLLITVLALIITAISGMLPVA